MATTAARKIGFVGLGHMGGSMAARFLAGGYLVYGEQQHRTAHAQGLIDEGLQWCDTPREVAEAVDVVASRPSPTTACSSGLLPARTGSSPASGRGWSGST